MVSAEIKERALALRREGRTYREILAVTPVAKSTLSGWFRDVSLSTRQVQRITEKRLIAARCGANIRRKKRINEVNRLKEEGKNAVDLLTPRELWLIGTALYWAEGSKQNKRSVSACLVFGNMDMQMVRVYLAWLDEIGVPKTARVYSLYVHRDRQAQAVEYAAWWAESLGIPAEKIKLYFKRRSSASTNRTNTGDLYRGIIRIKVRASTTLNRKVNGWTAGIVAAVGSGVTGNTSAFGAEDSRIVP